MIKLGPRVRVGPIFVRGNFVTEPDNPGADPDRSGDLLTTTAFERGQRNLNFLQLFNNAAPISFPGKEDKPSCRWWSRSRNATTSTTCCTSAAAARPSRSRPDSSLPVRLVRARRLRQPQPVRPRAGTRQRQVDYGTSLARGNPTLSRPALFRHAVSLRHLAQHSTSRPRRGWATSARAAARSAFRARCIPGVDAGIHYNLRNTTHTEILLPPPGPTKRWGRHAGDRPSAACRSTSSGCASTTAWCRRAASNFDAMAEIALPALGAVAATALRRRRRHLREGGRRIRLPWCRCRRWLLLRHGLRFDQGFPLGGESLLPKVERYFAGRRHHAARLQAGSRAHRKGALPDLLARRRRPLGVSTARSAATCASCRTSICSSRSARPSTARSSSTTASSPTRSTA